jgi:HAD superfamily hydrolase (TIGR01509 family)
MSGPGPLSPPALVMFDVDYTLLHPGPRFEAEGYRSLGAEFDLDLDPSRWDAAERAVHAAVRERRERLGTAHDQGLYEVIATTVIEALGGGDASAVTAAAREQVAQWGRLENFVLYDDVVPCLATLRAAGLRIALVSNTDRDLVAAAEHFGLGAFIDHAVASCLVGHCKPAPQIFTSLLELAGVPAEHAVMVGDDLEDDVAGAVAVGCRAVLLDRGGRRDVALPTIRSLVELPGLLGLSA